MDYLGFEWERTLAHSDSPLLDECFNAQTKLDLNCRNLGTKNEAKDEKRRKKTWEQGFNLSKFSATYIDITYKVVYRVR